MEKNVSLLCPKFLGRSNFSLLKSSILTIFITHDDAVILRHCTHSNFLVLIKCVCRYAFAHTKIRKLENHSAKTNEEKKMWHSSVRKHSFDGHFSIIFYIRCITKIYIWPACGFIYYSLDDLI